MIECKKCKKQYIRETKRTLRKRFTEHGQATNNPSHTNADATVPSRFTTPGQSSSDMLLPTNDTSRRKAREAYLKFTKEKRCHQSG